MTFGGVEIYSRYYNYYIVNTIDSATIRVTKKSTSLIRIVRKRNEMKRWECNGIREVWTHDRASPDALG